MSILRKAYIEYKCIFVLLVWKTYKLSFEIYSPAKICTVIYVRINIMTTNLLALYRAGKLSHYRLADKGIVRKYGTIKKQQNKHRVSRAFYL